MSQREFELADTMATDALGAGLARQLPVGGAVIFLQGELGAGKTALARAFLQTLGHTGRVRSPSYTLVEPYELAGRRIFHLDLYRLSEAEELEYLGLRDLDPEQDLLLVEWPERGGLALPAPDLWVRLAYAGLGRRAVLSPESVRGTTILSGL